ncbi:hypothetical protein KDN34_02540 [Shewanella yunxiaonensis]|uniref:Uncharacterized protein n=1 Tax=Shewanella yunxiaonensis TaxID=2829809 RepID=A0ABX7YUA0_9GAMM|nr:hypothetical protein [Shewanella yunxiaonensis]QUN06363.1 hypothetical protein KDN34_02540 [Shewanella yunxiaonensis]
MKKLLVVAIVFCAVQVQAETLKGGYGACLTEELFDQLSQAAVKKDEQGWQYLLNNGCIITKSGIQVSVLDTTWTGKAKVRAYVGDQAVVLWTNVENIQR